jgi:hypothetical protein
MPASAACPVTETETETETERTFHAADSFPAAAAMPASACSDSAVTTGQMEVVWSRRRFAGTAARPWGWL